MLFFLHSTLETNTQKRPKSGSGPLRAALVSFARPYAKLPPLATVDGRITSPQRGHDAGWTAGGGSNIPCSELVVDGELVPLPWTLTAYGSGFKSLSPYVERGQ